ncbi:MAG: HlyD family efflux transporter periplasmic adaptor subunit [Merismopedia sp. SIO2A8]|nr:HlyD family efflux transporter periplasmic adaptor subunit [Merismopedia sp. SIO2A8]
MNKNWIFFTFGIGLLCGSIAPFGLRLLPSQPERSVALDVVSSAPQPTAIAALGRLEPQGKVVKLAPPSSLSTAARVQEIYVQEGDFIEPNQVIAILDSYNERQAQLTEAKSRVNHAQARLRQVEAGAKQGEINAQMAAISQIEGQTSGDLQVQAAQIERLQAEYDNTVAEYHRYQSLFDEGAISALSMDSHHTLMVAARERLQEVKDMYEKLERTGQDRVREAEATLNRIIEIRPVDLEVAKAEVQIAIAEQTRAEAALEQTRIRAPMAGQVLRLHSQPGELIGNDGMATLGQTDVMYAIAEIYESDINWIHVGQTATIASEYGGFTGELTGVVEAVGLEILNNSLYDPNPTSRSEVRIIEVTVRLDELDSERVRHLTNSQVQVKINT